MVFRSSVLVSRLAATFVLLSSSAGKLRATAALSAFPGNNKTLLQAMSSAETSSSHLVLHHCKEPVGSTQDEARRLLREAAERGDDTKCLAVIADEQNQGRGTQGRLWEGGGRKGNLYLTVCIPMDMIPVTFTLLPLQVGVLVAQRVSRLIQACQMSSKDNTPRVRVKWPNDVLVNDQKISGTLIENETIDGTSWLLIGVGVNIAFSPSLTESPGKHVRGATCIQGWCSNQEPLPSNTANILGSDLANALVEWVVNDESKQKSIKEMEVIEDWKTFADFGIKYELRGDVESEMAGTHKGEEVIVVDIQYDGQLLIRGENGRERLLVADYMF